jgi:hypothetical protein
VANSMVSTQAPGHLIRVSDNVVVLGRWHIVTQAKPTTLLCETVPGPSTRTWAVFATGNPPDWSCPAMSGKWRPLL